MSHCSKLCAIVFSRTTLIRSAQNPSVIFTSATGRDWRVDVGCAMIVAVRETKRQRDEETKWDLRLSLRLFVSPSLRLSFDVVRIMAGKCNAANRCVRENFAIALLP